MAVHVKLAPHARVESDNDWDASFVESSGQDLTYEYEIHPSGALVVYRVFADATSVVDQSFGPGAWTRVTGNHLETRVMS